MTRQLSNISEHGFEWYDISAPSKEELNELATKYGLHPALINDCLQPGHLPKYEKMDEYSFVIFRIHVDTGSKNADSVLELTDKVAVFFAEKFIITVHKDEQPFLYSLGKLVAANRCTSTAQLLNQIIYTGLNTYEESVNTLSQAVDYYEEVVFLRPKKISMLKGLYHLKRKIDLVRRMLILSYEIIDFVDSETGNVDTRDTRDEYVKLQHMFDVLSEDLHQLLNVYFSASSQRTNEIIRVLTIFSVFFLPLTFIVGVYGMNFDFMPELTWKLGYPGVIVLMVAVTVLIFLWFKRKKWL
ncbi:MAG: Mg2 transporter protein CorA family protein [Flavipsychrobacter sp.]|jgi:magnesium transporter|nr:Mg2 transporter protein CorA family protein [Flavipsychrobacter sp.]